ncbi:MAG: histidine triad nucleotide-binding protein [Candidatus Sulfobium sp.]|jgi:histidine triad (HIT) family protein
MTDCIFCRIISGETAARIIYEDETAVAIEDINPQAPVHVLVIPRKHIATNLDLGPEETPLVGHLFEVANKIAREKDIARRGFRLVMNTNAEAGQSVFHIHLHLLGGRPMHWPPG